MLTNCFISFRIHRQWTGISVMSLLADRFRSHYYWSIIYLHTKNPSTTLNNKIIYL